MLRFWKVLGKNPSAKEREAFRSLSYFKGRRFRSSVGPLKLNYGAVFRIACKAFLKVPTFKKQNVTLSIPSVQTNLKQPFSEEVSVVWLGHSSFLIQADGLTILVDPVLSAFASPFPGAVRAFEGTQIYHADDFPPIDYLLITHDHYDHLDYDSVVALRSRVRQAVVPLGVGSHLRYWGYAPRQVVELGLFDSHSLKDDVDFTSSTLTVTPARHLSGRSLRMGRTLWASFVLNLGRTRLFLGGDGGYGEHFKDIGLRFGPFDLAFLENGQYNTNWPNNHMFPEQVLQACQDLRANMIFPIHWGKFCLSNHRWNAPIQRLLSLADEQNIPVTVPHIGERYLVGTPACRDAWWLKSEQRKEPTSDGR